MCCLKALAMSLTAEPINSYHEGDRRNGVCSKIAAASNKYGTAINSRFKNNISVYQAFLKFNVIWEEPSLSELHSQHRITLSCPLFTMIKNSEHVALQAPVFRISVFAYNSTKNCRHGTKPTKQPPILEKAPHSPNQWSAHDLDSG